MIYAALVDVGNDTQLLCFAQHETFQGAYDIVEANIAAQYPGREYRINLFQAACSAGDFEIVNINLR